MGERERGGERDGERERGGERDGERERERRREGEGGTLSGIVEVTMCRLSLLCLLHCPLLVPQAKRAYMGEAIVVLGGRRGNEERLEREAWLVVTGSMEREGRGDVMENRVERERQAAKENR